MDRLEPRDLLDQERPAPEDFLRMPLTIQADRAYGERRAPPTIPPNSTPVFDIEPLKIQK